MIGMRSEKLLDAPPVEPKLLFDRKKHLYLTQGQEALGFDSGCGASKFGGPSKDLHASRPLVATPEPAAVQEVLPLSLAGLSQGLGSRKTLQKHPGRDTRPILKGLESRGIIFREGMAQLLNKGGALFNQTDFIPTE